MNIVHSSNTLARATASLTYFAMTAVFRNAVVTASLPWLDGRSITARTALAFSSVAQSVTALAAMVGGSGDLLASTTKSAQTLPVAGSPPLVSSLPAQSVSLPVGHGLDMYSAALEPHFKAAQLNASRTVYKIKISPANLHMTCREGKSIVPWCLRTSGSRRLRSCALASASASVFVCQTSPSIGD